PPSRAQGACSGLPRVLIGQSENRQQQADSPTSTKRLGRLFRPRRRAEARERRRRRGRCPRPSRPDARAAPPRKRSSNLENRCLEPSATGKTASGVVLPQAVIATPGGHRLFFAPAHVRRAGDAQGVG